MASSTSRAYRCAHSAAGFIDAASNATRKNSGRKATGVETDPACLTADTTVATVLVHF